jgi:uncharacterized protein
MTSNIFEFNTHELPRRAGEMKEYQLDLILPDPIGVPLISIPAGDTLEVDIRLESVTEGVLLSAEIFGIAKGDCIRCLDPVEVTVDKKIQELYRYEPTADSRSKKKSKSRGKDEDVDLESDDELWMDGNIINLEVPILDAVILELPANPLCDPDCEGLCPDCGEKWAKLPPEHLHEAVDARWAGLAGLDFQKSDE